MSLEKLNLYLINNFVLVPPTKKSDIFLFIELLQSALDDVGKKKKYFLNIWWTGWTRTGYPSRLMDLLLELVLQLLIARPIIWGQRSFSLMTRNSMSFDLSSNKWKSLFESFTVDEAKKLSFSCGWFVCLLHFTPEVMQTCWVYTFPQESSCNKPLIAGK